MSSDTRHSTLLQLFTHLCVVCSGLLHEVDSRGTCSTNGLCDEWNGSPTPVLASSLLQRYSSTFPILNDVRELSSGSPRLNGSSGKNTSSAKHSPIEELESQQHQQQGIGNHSVGGETLKSVFPETKLEVVQKTLVGKTSNLGGAQQTTAEKKQSSDAAVKQKAMSKRIMSSQTTATSSIVVGVLLLALGVPWPGKSESVKQGGRSILLDNAKVFAQFLVIYMRVVSTSFDGSWNGGNRGFDDGRRPADLSKTLFDGFRAISIPMLCFISGMLSQEPPTERKVRRFVWHLLVPVLLWVYFAKPVILDTMKDLDPEAFMARLRAVWHLQSYREEWYLQALVIWRGSVVLLWSHFNPAVSLFSMFGLSAVAGYLNFSSSLWKSDAAFGFLPYFAVGYVFPFHAAYHATERRHVPVVVAGALVFLWVFALIPLAGLLPDGFGNYNCCTAGTVFHSIDALDYSLYWTRRVARVILELVPTLMLLFYVIPRSTTILSWVGPYVLYPFLFQEVSNHWWDHFTHHAHTQKMTATGHAVVFLVHVPYVLAVLTMFASRPWRLLFSWCFEPKWLAVFLKDEPDHLLEYSAEKAATENSFLEHQSFEKPSIAQAELNSHALKRAGLDLPIKEKKSAPEEDVASVDSIPELLPSRASCRYARWRSTGPPIPWQSEARPYYPLLAPIFIGLVLFTTCLAIWCFSILFPLLNVVCEAIPLFLFILALVAALMNDLITYSFHYFRFRGTDKEPESSAADPLTHAVIVCAYKEPLDVLIRTFDSLAKQRGIWKGIVVVFAAEARDESAQAAYDELARRFGNSFGRFMLTSHFLTEGEAIGKSSNENFAGQELYRRLVEEEGQDPFEVLVTVVDADSILSPTYLAHAESSYRCRRDGRRLIYSGPLNTYRNFADAGFLVQSHEMRRCHDDTFMCPLIQYAPLSNYSLSLGFLQEIDFWTPDVMPEDIHAANRAMLNSFGSRTTIPIPSIICNDLVVQFADRYTQAKRHHYGSISEFAWMMSLFRAKFDFHAWWQIFQAEIGRPGSFVSIAIDLSSKFMKVFICYVFFAHWSMLTWKTRLYIGCGLAASVWQHFWFVLAEGILWNTLLDQFPIKKPSPGRWLLLVITMPLVSFINSIVFTVVPTLDCLWHITFKGELAYVCAPKGDSTSTVQDVRGGTKTQRCIVGKE